MKTFRKKPLGKASAKAQSAMEYLMTYGWAILIISVVLAALFQLSYR
jgi:multidrug efflux pump subunit AcrB